MRRKDNWRSDSARSSLSRTHSALLLGPLLRQRTTYADSNDVSPSNRGASSQSSSGSVIINQGRHVTPNWYHLSLVEMDSHKNQVSSKSMTRRTSINDNEIEETCQMIQRVCSLRAKYLYKNTKQNGHIGSIIKDEDICFDVNKMKPILPKSVSHKYSFKFIDGVTHIFDEKDPIFETHSFDEYFDDLQFIFRLMAYGPAKSLCYKRLKILQCRFRLHLLLNDEVEATESHSVPYRDFCTLSCCISLSPSLYFFQQFS